MTCEVHNKEINSQCAELLLRFLYNCPDCEIGGVTGVSMCYSK